MDLAKVSPTIVVSSAYWHKCLDCCCKYCVGELRTRRKVQWVCWLLLHEAGWTRELSMILLYRVTCVVYFYHVAFVVLCHYFCFQSVCEIMAYGVIYKLVDVCWCSLMLQWAEQICEYWCCWHLQFISVQYIKKTTKTVAEKLLIVDSCVHLIWHSGVVMILFGGGYKFWQAWIFQW